MKNENNDLKKQYNKTPNKYLANSLAILFGCDLGFEGYFEDLINCAKRVDKALIYCPLSFPEWMVEENGDVKARLLKLSPIDIKVVATPTRNRVQNFMDMFALNKEVTLFDALKKANKSFLVVSSSKAIADAVQRKGVNVLNSKGFANLTNTAIHAIRENQYDVVIVVDEDYDECIKVSSLKSKMTRQSVDDLINRYELLKDATEVFWTGDVLVGFCPDRGSSQGLIFGKRGTTSPSDCNVVYMFDVNNN